MRDGRGLEKGRPSCFRPASMENGSARRVGRRYLVEIGFQTLAKPSSSKSLMLAVANSVTPKA